MVSRLTNPSSRSTTIGPGRPATASRNAVPRASEWRGPVLPAVSGLAAEDDTVELYALLVDRPDGHRRGPVRRGRVHVDGDEGVVPVPGLRPVDGLVGVGEVELAGVRPDAGLRVRLDHGAVARRARVD